MELQNCIKGITQLLVSDGYLASDSYQDLLEAKTSIGPRLEMARGLVDEYLAEHETCDEEIVKGLEITSRHIGLLLPLLSNRYLVKNARLVMLYFCECRVHQKRDAYEAVLRIKEEGLETAKEMILSIYKQLEAASEVDTLDAIFGLCTIFDPESEQNVESDLADLMKNSENEEFLDWYKDTRYAQRYGPAKT